MSTRKNSTQCHEIRQQLLKNGYKPLPAAAKGVYIDKWSTVTIDRAFLEQFKRRHADYYNTGLRCDNLIVFDIDVLDTELANRIENLIEKTVGKTELCRYGREPKRLLLYRLEGDAGRSQRTGKYGDHMVELLCGSGRQFIADGLHPSGVDYRWDSQISPVGVPYGALSPCSYEDASKAMELCDEALQATGLPLNTKAYTFSDSDTEYDLTDDFRILLEDGTETTWGAYRDELTEDGVMGNIVREHGEFGDSNGIKFALSNKTHEPYVCDFTRGVRHFEPAIDPQKVADELPAEPEQTMFANDFYEDLIENYLLVGDGTVRHIDNLQIEHRLMSFKQLYADIQLQHPHTGKSNTAVNWWQLDPRRMRADYAQLRPDRDEIIFREKNANIFNTYIEPQHPQHGGEIDTVMEFVEHLVPDPRERALFLDWHTVKLHHPEYRLHALVMYTPEFGVGRNTWNDIQRKLLGDEYVIQVPIENILGSTSQSQYTDYLSESLLVTVPEVSQDASEKGYWKARMSAYETIKQIVDPSATKMLIVRKNKKNTRERVFTSFCFNTNHRDALIIEPGDRRLIVLDNGRVKLNDPSKKGLKERIHAWMKDPQNIGAFYRYLWARDVHYDPFGDPMDTGAKQRMMQANKSHIDEIFGWIVDKAPGDVMTPKQFEAWWFEAYNHLDMKLPDYNDDPIYNDIEFAKRRKTFRLNLTGDSVSIQNRDVRPLGLRNELRWAGPNKVFNKSARQEILKNGSPFEKITKAEFAKLTRFLKVVKPAE